MLGKKKRVVATVDKMPFRVTLWENIMKYHLGYPCVWENMMKWSPWCPPSKAPLTSINFSFLPCVHPSSAWPISGSLGRSFSTTRGRLVPVVRVKRAIDTEDLKAGSSRCLWQRSFTSGLEIRRTENSATRNREIQQLWHKCTPELNWANEPF